MSSTCVLIYYSKLILIEINTQFNLSLTFFSKLFFIKKINPLYTQLALCYVLYDLNKDYQSLETHKRKERKWKKTRIWGTGKTYLTVTLRMSVYDKVPLQNIKNKPELLMCLVCLLLLVAGRSCTIISAGV